jgi:hypothetical protein
MESYKLSKVLQSQLKSLEPKDTEHISQEYFLSIMLNPNEIKNRIVTLPKNTLIFHGSQLFPRLLNQKILIDNIPKKVSTILPYIEGGASESEILSLSSENKLTMDGIYEILHRKQKKYEMLFGNFNWMGNRYIEGGQGCNPCKSMVLFLLNNEIKLFNFIDFVRNEKKDKRSIEDLDQKSEKKLYIVSVEEKDRRQIKKKIIVKEWDKITDSDVVFEKINNTYKSVKPTTELNTLLYITNNDFYTSGYTGIGIIFAQYQYIQDALQYIYPDFIDQNIMGYIAIDFSEEVKTDTTNEDWFSKENESYFMRGCIGTKNIGICPEVLILNPTKLLTPMDVFYTTRNDYEIFIKTSDRIKEEKKRKALPLKIITKNIENCLKSYDIQFNPSFNTRQPIVSLEQGHAPYYVLN